MTLGEQGAWAAGPEGVLETPAFAIQARDTTGAGDAFHAGFVWGLFLGLDALGTLRRAHAVAALNCLAPGAQGGLPDAAAVERFLAERADAGVAAPGGRRG